MYSNANESRNAFTLFKTLKVKKKGINFHSVELRTLLYEKKGTNVEKYNIFKGAQPSCILPVVYFSCSMLWPPAPINQYLVI